MELLGLPNSSFVYLMSGRLSSPLGENYMHLPMGELPHRLVGSFSKVDLHKGSEIMPKRFGYVWEEVVSQYNCEQAVLDALRNKKKTRYLKYVRKHYKEYGTKIRNILLNGWQPKPIRLKTINEGTNQKTRNLRIPSLIDHIIHTAVSRVLQKYLLPKFYYYASGSIPKKGQLFSKNAVVHMLKSDPKYGAECDVKKFYDNTSSDAVMNELRRIFKDEKFLALNEKILEQMGGHLAIGFTLSHWYAHMVLMRIDHYIKENFTDVSLTRSMDNFVMVSDSKESLHRAIEAIDTELRKRGLWLKGDWQVFPLSSRPIKFLSYRQTKGKTVMKKNLMVRISRRMRHLAPSARTARIIVSYLGILKHCDSHNFKCKYVYPYQNIKESKRLISNADRKRILLGTA